MARKDTEAGLHTSCLVSEIKHAPLIPHPAAYIPHAKTLGASSVTGILKPARAGLGKNAPNAGLGRVSKSQREGLVKMAALWRWMGRSTVATTLAHASRIRKIVSVVALG